MCGTDTGTVFAFVVGKGAPFGGDVDDSVADYEAAIGADDVASAGVFDEEGVWMFGAAVGGDFGHGFVFCLSVCLGSSKI